MSDELVLVVPSDRLGESLSAGGFVPFSQEIFDSLTHQEFMEFRPRSEAEEDESFKQLIPYCIIQYGDGVYRKFFQYMRSSQQGESRLHGSRSLGVGGHISQEDQADGNPYAAGMRRELEEELELTAQWAEQPIGFIYDPSTPVGRVHVGVVHLITVDSLDGVKAREAGLADSGFYSIAQLEKSKREFEAWSQLCIDNLLACSKCHSKPGEIEVCKAVLNHCDCCTDCRSSCQ